MEIISEGTHFRLVRDDELPSILEILQQFMPEAIKVDKKLAIFIVSVV